MCLWFFFKTLRSAETGHVLEVDLHLHQLFINSANDPGKRKADRIFVSVKYMLHHVF